MIFYKTIIQGRLSFNNEKSFGKVHKMFEYRTETYYKNDVLVDQEEIFNDEALTLSIPRFVGNATDKSFRNTVSLLEYCSQFAVSGEINAWMINEGKVINQKNIQPDSDKAIVMQFRKADEYFRLGHDGEALEALNRTLEKYDAHAQAYERRGWVNMRLKNYSDALYDFNKAIKIDDSIAFAYHGKAIIARNEDNLEEAIKNFELTLKKSVALESLYWKARVKKAECHINRGEWDKAEFDLRFFTKRKFKEGDKNLRKKAYGHMMYSYVLLQKEMTTEALEQIDLAFENYSEDSKGFTPAKGHYYRGLIKQALGKKDFKEELKKAQELGSKKAEELLAQV